MRWPYPEMWWVLCGRHELDAVFFGPFATRESAERDARKSQCDHAHFAVMGVPPLPPTAALLPSVVGFERMEGEAQDQIEWLSANVGKRDDGLEPLRALECRRLNDDEPALPVPAEPF